MSEVESFVRPGQTTVPHTSLEGFASPHESVESSPTDTQCLHVCHLASSNKISRLITRMHVYAQAAHPNFCGVLCSEFHPVVHFLLVVVMLVVVPTEWFENAAPAD